ncbi:hypothetical protein WA538_004794 [Blastocystis sp. DL]
MNYSEVAQQDELKELISGLKKYTPIIPDEVTKYLLQTAGCNVEDEESIRLVSLAAQRYVTELISKAKEYNVARRDGKTGDANDDALLLVDLQNALHDKGIDMNKAESYSL